MSAMIRTDWPGLLEDAALDRLAERACGQQRGRAAFASRVRMAAMRVRENGWLQPAVASRRIEIAKLTKFGVHLAGWDEPMAVKRADRLFAGGRALVVSVKTLGPALEDELTRLSRDHRMAEMIALEQVAVNCLFALSEREHETLIAACQARGEDVGSPLCPGDGGFSFAAQSRIYHMAGADRIGVSLSQSGMLKPLKSLSSVVAIGQAVPTWARTETCGNCKAASKCRFRKHAGPPHMQAGAV
ncbi:MAG: hypothetical protein K8F59_11410 [Rhodobacteraceae bacterium]|nr:hypothetical protein [Paracoccaceae bacterium]